MVLLTYPEELHKSGPVINNQNKTLDVALSKLLLKPESVRSGSNRVRPLSSMGGGNQGTRHCHAAMPPSGHHSCQDIKYQARAGSLFHHLANSSFPGSPQSLQERAGLRCADVSLRLAWHGWEMRRVPGSRSPASCSRTWASARHHTTGADCNSYRLTGKIQAGAKHQSK